MSTQQERTVDLLISHSQILIRARAYDENLSQWGPGNGEQGAVLHPDYLIFDPLPDEAFGAFVYLRRADSFSPDPNAARSIVAPIVVAAPSAVEVASAAEEFAVDLGLQAGNHSVFFEVCEGDEEIYYRFTLVPTATPEAPRFLLDDEWDGTAGAPLQFGIF
ncbi:competence protein ComJ [Gulosibacter massiliensis]|uniref:competence protein ComJ n=1 Tax=Gulosibacter massiliensis TaxID=2479839 RepID=UPI000F631F5D|nr:competence protein ComJ [Gulosibacter massiliensis]